MAFQEGPENSIHYSALAFDFRNMFGFDYQVALSDVDGGGNRTGLVYNAERLALIDSQSINDMGFTHFPTVATFQPLGGTAEDIFSVISIQLKKGNSSPDLLQRETEAIQVGNIVDSLPAGRPVIFLGDFNLQGSIENAWTELSAAGALETINAPVGLRVANWNDSLAFHPFHTEDATGLAGGLDDLFDRLLTSSEFMDGSGIEYNPGTLTVFGNNGTHLLNGGLMTGSGAAAVQANLISISDHLPVFADFDWGVTRTTPAIFLSNEAVDNWTVRPTGPRSGGNGTNFFHVFGSGNGNAASFGVLDFDLAGILSTFEVATRIEEIRLALIQDNGASTHDGPISIFVASAAATNILINSGIQFVSGNDGLDCVPSGLPNGAELAATFPGVHHGIDGNVLPDGTLEEIVLNYDTIRTAIINALNTGGKIRLIVVPNHPGTAVTYAGNTNGSFAGPSINGLYDSNGSRHGEIRNQTDPARISIAVEPMKLNLS